MTRRLLPHERKLDNHGLSRSREYSTWHGMVRRCHMPSDPGYERYGARGIAVCERWRKFRLFFEDMGPKPTPRHSLDRIDNSKGYEPGNCRWSTPREQTLNRGVTRWLTHDGVTLCVTDWAARLNARTEALFSRLWKGWSVERALTTPFRKKNPKGAGRRNPRHRRAA